MSNLKKTLKAAVIAVPLTVGAATDAFSRCVTGVGNQFNETNIAEITKKAHARKIAPGYWDPDSRFLKPSGPLPDVRVGRFSFSNAVEGCESQHLKERAKNPGQRVTTGLTCGRRVYTIQDNPRVDLVCE